MHVMTVDENGRPRETLEIIGVARDARQTALRGQIEHRFYRSAAQLPDNLGSISLLIRSHGDASGVAADVRRVVREAQPTMPILRTTTVAASIALRITEDRMLAQLSIAFGAVAVLLVAIGLYGVLSYGVARRTNEIGIRKALGARHSTLIAMILRETGVLVVSGMILGSALSVGIIRLISARLFGLEPNDPVTFAIGIASLAIVAGIATWMPAFRASRVDPLVALRCE
jgi:ABC-type antimicrobial peptide transport system permease subunit